MRRGAPSATTVVSAGAQCRHVSTGRFNHPPYSFRQRHTHNTLPIHDANYFGGRLARLREIGPVDGRKRGRQFKRDKDIAQYNVDIWCAQQTLRKRWKARDYDVVEMPFSLAPKELQRVIPELYSDIPLVHVDPVTGARSNLRAQVYDLEDLQSQLFNGAQLYPALKRVDKTALTLDKFL